MNDRDHTPIAYLLDLKRPYDAQHSSFSKSKRQHTHLIYRDSDSQVAEVKATTWPPPPPQKREKLLFQEYQYLDSTILTIWKMVNLMLISARAPFLS